MIGMATRRKSSSTTLTKKVSVTSSERGSQQSLYTTQRVKELESQVSELKKRLDDLRKAKSQTIVKKDKEYVSTAGPKLGQRETRCTCKESFKASQGKEQHTEKEIEMLKDQIAKLKMSHVEELEKIKNYRKEMDSESQLDLIKLQEKCKELEERNASLEAHNAEQKLRIEELYELLSKKEAEWCDKEEKLKIELKLSWGKKYQQWMAETEQKIEELHTANEFLKKLLQKDRAGRSGNSDA